MAGTARHYGKAGGEGEIHVWGGIVSGRVAHLAGALETTPGALLDAVDAAGVMPMVDTAKQNDRKDRDRPTDPEKRCLAFTTEAFEDLRDAIDAEAPSAVPA